jgi:uncharacterized membrane protein
MTNRRAAQITGALVALMALGSLAALYQLPAGASVPVHFDLYGHSDRWAPAAFGLFITPSVTAAIWLLMLVLPQIDPRGQNLIRSSSAYGTIWISITALLCVFHALIVAAALGAELDAGRVMTAATGAMFIVVGNVFGKLRWNYTVGIRTPWTLADQRVWDKTHRFGGWLFVIGGFALLAGAFAPLAVLVRGQLLLTVIVTVIVLTVGKSYLLWREQQKGQGKDGRTSRACPE